jgi:hypothetical protein
VTVLTNVSSLLHLLSSTSFVSAFFIVKRQRGYFTLYLVKKRKHNNEKHVVFIITVNFQTYQVIVVFFFDGHLEEERFCGHG